MTYQVRPNFCNCHPETCCCNNWAIYRQDGSKFSTFFDKADAEKVATALNVTEGQ